LSYQIGTRNVSTLLRLKDGETQVLAGLISDEARSTTSKVPGLGDLPIAGRLFTNQGDNNQKTEIVLSITPRLIRNLQRTGPEEFWSGTDATLRTRPMVVQAVADAGKGAVVAGASPAQPLVASATSSTVGAQAAAVEGSFSWEGPSQVKLGQLFRIALKIKTDGNIGGLPFEMGYDPRTMELVDISQGEFFKQGVLTGNFTSNVAPGAGKLTIDTSSPDADGAKGEGSLVNVTFKAIAASAKTEIKLLSASGVSIPMPKAHVLAISAN
jgi:general secretion pathway protein D